MLRAFEAAQVQSLLLKGASIKRWLYANGEPRPYGDCDLLVRPDDLERAQQVLSDLGFEPTHDEAEMPEWWRAHAVAWLRHSDAVAVDLHRTIEGVGVDPSALWETLSAHAEPLTIGGYDANALTIPGRAFHLALHAAQHGQGWGPVTDELELAVTRADRSTWQAAAELARALGAERAFAAGLRLAPSGGVLAEDLGLPADQPVSVALRAATAPSAALGFEELARTRGLRPRLEIVRYKLFPPPTFMRKWSPNSGQGRHWLARAYAARAVWILRKAPAGFSAWRRARRRPPPAA